MKGREGESEQWKFIAETWSNKYKHHTVVTVHFNSFFHNACVRTNVPQDRAFSCTHS